MVRPPLGAPASALSALVALAAFGAAGGGSTRPATSSAAAPPPPSASAPAPLDSPTPTPAAAAATTPPEGASPLQPDDILNHRYRIAAIAPSRTSIYIGSVSLTVEPLVLQGGAYESKYVATVFPYFFYNERGSFSIAMPPESLRRVSRSEPFEFTGRAVSSDGEERRISGKAVPTDATHGRIKVRIFVSKRIALIFNTTYEIRP